MVGDIAPTLDMGAADNSEASAQTNEERRRGLSALKRSRPTPFFRAVSGFKSSRFFGGVVSPLGPVGIGFRKVRENYLLLVHVDHLDRSSPIPFLVERETNASMSDSAILFSPPY